MDTQKKNTKAIVANICFIIVALGLAILQIGYLTIGKKYHFEYVIDSVYYLVNQLLLLVILLLGLRLCKKRRVKLMISTILIVLTIINLVFLFHTGLENKCMVEFSKDFKHQLVLKQNRKTGEVTIYKNVILLFARPKEQFNATVTENIKTQWITNDTCTLTYQDTKGKLHQYVATYGDRGDGISYYYVAAVIEGSWTRTTQNSSGMYIKKDTQGITIRQDGTEEKYEFSECTQYGTIALVLSKNDIPKWTIVLNKDANLDEETGLVQQGGTILLCEVSMEPTAALEFYRISK